MMKIVLTGGAGYIGSVLSRRLLDEGHELVVCDRLSFDPHAVLACLGARGYTFVRRDLLTSEPYDQIFSGADVVIHLAAIVGEHACRGREELAWRTNHDLAIRVSEECARLKVPRLLYFSTCSNYGVHASSEAREDDELHPIGPYAKAKVEAEKKLLSAKSSTSITIFRSATVYGLSPRMRFDLLLNELVRDAYFRKELKIYGPDAWRPFVHVRDLSEAVVRYLSTGDEAVGGEVFNVGGPDGNKTKRALVELLSGPVGGFRVEYAEAKEDPRNYQVDFSKIRRTLGFRTMLTLEEGVTEITSAFRNAIFPDPFHPRYSNFEEAAA